MDAIFYEAFSEEKRALLRHLPKEVKADFSKGPIPSKPSPKPPARLISIRTQSIIPCGWAAHLAGVLTRSSGYDHVVAFRSRCKGNVSCGYLPSYCARAVAEHALLMTMTLARKLKRQMKNFTAFDRDDITGTECLNRTLVVAGVGRIGSEIVRLGVGVGMRVLGVDLVKRLPSLEYVSLEEGVSVADVLVCALPLTIQTRGLLRYELLRRARRGMLFVNISRGEISPTRDLKRLLREGTLSGIGLDVFEDEPELVSFLRSGKGNLTPSGKAALQLLKDDRVLMTPHNAFNTQEALERKAKQSVESVVAFLRQGFFPDPIPEEAFEVTPPTSPPGKILEE